MCGLGNNAAHPALTPLCRLDGGHIHDVPILPLKKMKNDQASSEIRSLFSNDNPQEVWTKAASIICRINPDYDFSSVRATFDDIVRLFHGDYPGYCAVKTQYHDLQHTLDVFLCAARLMHGVHVSGTRLEDNEIALVAIAALMHDTGFAQQTGTETGSGAQHLQMHVTRGVEFMQRYLAGQHFPSGWSVPLERLIYSTDLELSFKRIHFLDERECLLGQIVGAADLLGQMADRLYLEKLLFLYEEFKEAGYGGYHSMHDLLRQTWGFYEMVRQRLDIELGGIHARLALHFKDWYGIERNFYMEAAEKNIAYLSKVILLDEEGSLSMLRRGGIVEKIRTQAEPDTAAQ
jgi:hypothetical protein